MTSSKDLAVYQSSVDAIRKFASQQKSDWTTVHKALGELASGLKAPASKLPTLIEASEVLRRSAEKVHLQDLFRLLEEIQPLIGELRQERTVSFGRELIQAFDKVGVHLSGKNPVYTSGTFRVALDFDADSASIQFGKLAIQQRLRLDVGTIVTGYQKATTALAKGYSGAEATLRSLQQAYDRVLRLESKERGKSVGIVSVLRETAVVSASPGFNANPTKENFRGLSRAQFAYNIHMLCREGNLTLDGKRLNLGVATITHTGKDTESIEIPGADGSPQSYMHLSFIEER